MSAHQDSMHVNMRRQEPRRSELVNDLTLAEQQYRNCRQKYTDINNKSHRVFNMLSRLQIETQRLKLEDFDIEVEELDLEARKQKYTKDFAKCRDWIKKAENEQLYPHPPNLAPLPVGLMNAFDQGHPRSSEQQAVRPVCEICGLSRKDLALMRKHMRRDHRDKLGEFDVPYPDDRQLYVCRQCPDRFERKNDLSSHMRRRHEPSGVTVPAAS